MTTISAYQNPFLGGLRVLVVDNNADNLELIKVILEDFSMLVMVAATVGEALKTLVGWKPDVLISDIALPDGDGYSLMRSVRILEKCEQRHQLAAIALTAWTVENGRALALDAGFCEYKLKPFDPNELVSVVAELVNDNDKEKIPLM